MSVLHDLWDDPALGLTQADFSKWSFPTAKQEFKRSSYEKEFGAAADAGCLGPCLPAALVGRGRVFGTPDGQPRAYANRKDAIFVIGGSDPESPCILTIYQEGVLRKKMKPQLHTDLDAARIDTEATDADHGSVIVSVTNGHRPVCTFDFSYWSRLEQADCLEKADRLVAALRV